MNPRRPQAGFTLMEMIVVISILLVIVAIALPNMVSVISASRQRSMLMMVSSTMQRCRSEAVRNNKVMQLKSVADGGTTIYYVTDPAGASTDRKATDPQVPLLQNVSYVSTPSGSGAPTAMDGNKLWGSSTLIPNTDGVISFNSRGLPCLYNEGNSTCPTGTGFIFYFNYLPPFGSNRWSALSVSPAGRVKAWYWDGSAWGD